MGQPDPTPVAESNVKRICEDIRRGQSKEAVDVLNQDGWALPTARLLKDLVSALVDDCAQRLLNTSAESQERGWLSALKLDPHLEELIIAEAQTGLLHLRENNKLLFQIQSVRTLGGEHLLAIDLVHAERGSWNKGVPSSLRCQLCEPHAGRIREATDSAEYGMPREFAKPLHLHLHSVISEHARIGAIVLADVELEALREAAVDVVGIDTERAIERVLLDEYIVWRQKANSKLAPYLRTEDWRVLFGVATQIDVTAAGGLSEARLEVFRAAEEILDRRIP